MSSGIGITFCLSLKSGLHLLAPVQTTAVYEVPHQVTAYLIYMCAIADMAIFSHLFGNSEKVFLY